MNKTDKVESLKELKESFSKANAAFFADYKGLTANQMNDLRKKLRASNVKVTIAKNNLSRIAVKDAKLGEKCEKMLDKMFAEYEHPLDYITLEIIRWTNKKKCLNTNFP